MKKLEANSNHRTTVQVAGPGLQSAEDYHQQYLLQDPTGQSLIRAKLKGPPRAVLAPLGLRPASQLPGDDPQPGRPLKCRIDHMRR
jgi:hypothetical protein